MRPSIVALVCGVLGLSSSIAACSEDSARPAAPVTTVAASASVAETRVPASTNRESTTTATTATTAPVDTVRPVITFADAASVEGWTNVDDSVMGGVSASTTSWESGQLVFAGELSLENNGGFASVRGPADPALGPSIGDAAALAVDVEGDGRTYVLQLRTSDESLYIARFATTAGSPERYVLPLDAFEPVTRFLEPAPATLPLEVTSVVQMAVYVLDAQEGTFRLAIAGIVAQ